jgi:hypothetical protein
MFIRHVKLAAAAAWLAMTTLVAAEPVTADTPMGDVWVTQDALRPLPAQAAQNVPGRRLLPTGDFWPAEDATIRAADTPAPPKDALAQEKTADGMK